jgi:iron(II)-dependent oxidoreductase
MPVLYCRLRDSRILTTAERDTAASVERQSWEPETVFIPAGSFLMGNNLGAGVENNERPQHSVSLPAYRIGKYPVTNEQYAEFVRQTGRSVPQMFTG